MPIYGNREPLSSTAKASECRIRERFWTKRRDVALQNAALTHVPGYEVEPVPCWKCHEVIPIFFWGVEIPEGKPRTLVRRKAAETENTTG